MIPGHAFVTGSHAYGDPREDSDIDLVILISGGDWDKLLHQSDYPMDDVGQANYLGSGFAPLRFGKLNLICTEDAELCDVWRKGTEELRNRKAAIGKAVTRDEAVEYLSKKRQELREMQEKRAMKIDHEFSDEWE